MEAEARSESGLVNLWIDGVPVSVPEGTTILDAARSVGILVPHLCHMKGLLKRAVCRLCVVECDGGGRLKAACATEVWEGVRVTVFSPELFQIRRSILELMLAGHPEDCLSCPRSLSCELQELAWKFGVRRRALLFENPAPDPADDGPALVRDQAKCVKCARCTAVCQDEQKVRAISTAGRSLEFEVCAPYYDSLESSPCLYCGRCASVCPVSAIGPRDDSELAADALGSPEVLSSALYSSELSIGLADELGIPASAPLDAAAAEVLRRLGFRHVLHRDFFSAAKACAEAAELAETIEGGGGLPLISLCGPAWGNYIAERCPELSPLVSRVWTADEIFAALLSGGHPEAAALAGARDPEGAPHGRAPMTLSPCLARKYERELRAGGAAQSSAALTVREVSRLARAAGIGAEAAGHHAAKGPAPAALAGAPFAGAPAGLPGLAGALYSLLKTGEAGRGKACGAAYGSVAELSAPFNGRTLKMALVFGAGAASDIFGAVLEGGSGYDYIKVMSCPGGCLEGGGQSLKTLASLSALRERHPAPAKPQVQSLAMPWAAEAYALYDFMKDKTGGFKRR